MSEVEIPALVITWLIGMGAVAGWIWWAWIWQRIGASQYEERLKQAEALRDRYLEQRDVLRELWYDTARGILRDADDIPRPQADDSIQDVGHSHEAYAAREAANTLAYFQGQLDELLGGE